MLNDDYRVERTSALKDVFLEVMPHQVFLNYLESKGKIGNHAKIVIRQFADIGERAPAITRIDAAIVDRGDPDLPHHQLIGPAARRRTKIDDKKETK